jgi:hypothetical protein
MKHKITISGVACLLLCVFGCSKPVSASRIAGEWQFDGQQTVMLLATNHAYTLKASDGRTTLGQWSLDGDRLIIVGQTWTNASVAIPVTVTNDTKITELSDSRMVLQNLGGPVSSLTRRD